MLRLEVAVLVIYIQSAHLKTVLKPDECSLQFVSVQLPNSTVPGVSSVSGNALYYPTSVRVQRCTGYCGKSGLDNDLRQCFPRGPVIIKSVTQLIQAVNPNAASGNSSLPATGQLSQVQIRRRQIPLETHTGCWCGCKYNPTGSCPLRRQRFDAATCRCECTNLSVKEKCSQRKLPWGAMFWDERRCQCRCPQFADQQYGGNQLQAPLPLCSNLFHFNHVKCRCVPKLLP